MTASKNTAIPAEDLPFLREALAHWGQWAKRGRGHCDAVPSNLTYASQSAFARIGETTETGRTPSRAVKDKGGTVIAMRPLTYGKETRREAVERSRSVWIASPADEVVDDAVKRLTLPQFLAIHRLYRLSEDPQEWPSQQRRALKNAEIAVYRRLTGA